MLTLYHGRTSVCSIKARLALAEKGVAWESRLLTLRGDQFDPDYMRLNPNAVVPTLVDDAKVIIESTAPPPRRVASKPSPQSRPWSARSSSRARSRTARCPTASCWPCAGG